MGNVQSVQYQGQQHYNDWYNGNKLKRTISEPTPIYSRGDQMKRDEVVMNDMPAIIDDIDDIDDSWNFITEIVNENKIPDLPPEKRDGEEKKILRMEKLIKSEKEKGFDDDDKMEIDDDEIPTKSRTKSVSKEEDSKENKEGNDEDKDEEEVDEITDVYTMMYQTMKDTDYGQKEKENKVIIDDDDDDKKRKKLNVFDDDDDDNKDSMEDQNLMQQRHENHMRALQAMMSDAKTSNESNEDQMMGPNISFADLSDFDNNNKPKTDDSFIPKVN